MRHRKKKVNVLQTWQQKKSILIRNLFTSLISVWQIKTTKHRAFVLKWYANNLLSRMVKLSKDTENGKRENIRLIKSIVFGNENGKKLLNEVLPKLSESAKWSYIADYKLGLRKWDSVEEVLVKIDY